MLNNLKLRGQIFLGFSLPVTLLLGLSGLIFITGTKVSQTFEEVERVQKVIIATDAIALRTSMMARQVRGYLLVQSDDPLREFAKQKKLYDQAVEISQPLILEPKQKQIFERIVEVGETYDAMCKKTFQLIQQRKLEAAIELYLRESKVLVGEIDRLNEDFKLGEIEILSQLTESATKSVYFLIFISVITGLLGLIFLAWLHLLFG